VAEEAEIPSHSGERIPVRFSGFLLFDNGRMIGSVGFYQDLRTFKKLEREKRDSDRLAVVGQTVAGLAHGIKNVIQGLEGGLFVVDTAIEDHDQTLLDRGWEMVRSNIGRVSALTQDLLSYSKERSPDFEKSNPNLLAEEVCALFDLKAKEKAITIRREFDPDIPEIFLDARGIHTCLSNLISNAIDACEMDEKPADHVIVVKTFQDAPWGVVFEVSDNGVGMDEETKTKVFSSFFSTKGSKGTGLGLLVTSKIVQEHGGEISFDSEPGEGTTFSISLPERTVTESNRATNDKSD
jgi:signal transduction histidine kinase